MVGGLAACGNPGEVLPAPTASTPGAPLPGLSAPDSTRFLAGLALFNRVFTPAEGLGPLFNENQCSACHTDPVSGGTGEQFMVRGSVFTEPDRCDLLPEYNGENLQTRAIPALRQRGVTGRPIPPHATHTGRTNVPFLFGGGLMEAIPESTLLEQASRNGGRVGRDTEGRVARFGRKAEHATLESFTAAALIQEMGLTSPIHPHELPLPEGSPPLGEVDRAPDPEIDASTLGLLVDFVRFLAPLPRILPDDPAVRDWIARGERIFEEVGCASCHVPYLDTGPHDNPALHRKRIYLYSDLLLHDMGPERSGACGVAARPSEYRTEPLTGLGRRRLLMHDSQALSIPEALELHGGQAAAARARWQELDELQRARLVRFLQSL